MTPDIHLMWITAKAAGLTAMVLASASVSVGLMMSARGRRSIEWRKAHEWLSLLTLGMIGLHGLALLLDPWLHPGWAGVLVPFASSYRPAATAAGVVAAWGLAFLGLSYYLRARIGAARWRRWHRWTALFWILGVAHGILAGTDGSRAWMLVLVAATGLPPAFLLLARIIAHGGAPRAGGRMPARVPVSEA